MSLARGQAELPLRQVMRLPDSRNVFALMPAHSAALGAVGAKLITVFPGNHADGADSHQGAVLLFDAGRGALRAIMDASSITAIRTAAVSAVATRLLARDARTLAIFGSGVQARTHVAAMLAIRRFDEVRVWSRTTAHAETFANEVKARHGIRVTVSVRPDQAAFGADVVCTVTSSQEPVLRGAWLAPGMHVNAVGASVPGARELDTDAIRKARVFVDRRESALAESGDLLTPMRAGVITADHIVAELGELLTGAAGRRSPDEITVFKSLGLAIEDLACARFLDQRARERNTGTWAEL